MHGRSCSSLLAVWLLTLCSSPTLWGQATAISANTPLHAKPPGHFPGPGSGPGSQPGGAPTFPQLARTAGTIFAGAVTRIEPGPSAGGSAVPTVAITRRTSPTRSRRGREFDDSRVAGPVVKRAALRSGGARASLPVCPSKLGLSSVVGGALGQFQLD